jgi:DNA end-binding protein Ku
MAPRPNWKGYLKLSLVSCPVALFPATTTSERVAFRTLNRATGNRVKRQFVDEATGDPVETEDQIKGYEVAKGEFIQIEDDELKAVQLESNHTIDIERFVPRSDVDQLYLDTPYYVTPTDRVGEEAFAVIRDAMRTEKMVGLARVVLFRRERILMLEPRTKGLVATSLHFANEVHAASGYFDEIPDLDLPKQMLELATHIIEKMRGHFEPEQFEDRYENALIDLIRAKQKGMPLKPQPTHRETNVINLMDALRRSVEGAGAGGAAEAAKPAAPEREPAARKPAAKEAAAKEAAPKARAQPRARGKARKAG